MFLASGASKGAVLALFAALAWGGGDFPGGMGVKTVGGTPRGALRVILAAHGMSLSALLLALHFVPGPPLRGIPAIWGLFAGLVAGLSLAAFYMALARGEMGAAAAVSGLLAAAIPAAIGIVLEGRPSALRLAGFLLAAASIWLIAAPETASPSPPDRGTLLLAIFGGIGFGVYFASLKFANPLGVLGPLTVARAGSLVTCALLLGVLRVRARAEETGPWLTQGGWLWAGGVALLDTAGNLLYIAATRAGRLDIAAVLASLYPASTILLAAAVLRERPGRKQLLGMAIALGAVILVTI